MKKITGFIAGIVLLLCIPYILKVGLWLIKIDNIEFGFPIWLDLGIDIISGAFAMLLAETLFRRKYDRSNATDVFSIIIGFIVGLIVHFILKYWYIWAFILAIIIGTFISLKIIEYKKELNKNKQKTEEED